MPGSGADAAHLRYVQHEPSRWADTPFHAASVHEGWPEGVIEMINAPCRRNGWRPWFSECPNDVLHFEMVPDDMAGLNALIQRLAAIEGEHPRRVVLSVASEPHALGFTTVLQQGNAIPAVFAMGNQQQVDEWYMRLPDGKFGIHQFDEPPTALPPTLTIYVGHDMVDLDGLLVPLNIDVVVDTAKRAPEDEPDTAYARLEKFAAAHQEKRSQSAPPHSPASKP